MLPGLDLYHADPAQPLTTAGEEVGELDHDLFDLSDSKHERSGSSGSSSSNNRPVSYTHLTLPTKA